MSPAEAALGAAGLSALAAIVVSFLNAHFSKQTRMAEDERRSRERSEAWARFEGTMTARFDEMNRRHDRTDEITMALHEKIAALPCNNCSPTTATQIIALAKKG